MNTSIEFLYSAKTRIKYYKTLGDKTLQQLTEKELYFQPNPENNSIAVMIQHLAGNMLSRWTDLLTTDGEKPWRDRDSEFEARNLSRQQLLDLWEKGWERFLITLEGLTEDDLLKTIRIRQEELLVMDAINRQMTHYPYHIGQMIYAARIIKDKDWQNLSMPKKT